MGTISTHWLPPVFSNIPEGLKGQPWAVWKAEPRSGQPGKFNKAPRSPQTGIKIGANKPDLFGTFDQARVAFNRGGFTGIGVLLTGNGIVGVDIDDYKTTFAEDHRVKQWVATAIKDGAYCEMSPSRTGLRLFMHGGFPGKGRKHGPLEIYSDARFLTVTGHRIELNKGGA